MKFIGRGYEIFWEGKLERILIGTRKDANDFCKEQTRINKEELNINTEFTVGESIPVYSMDEQ
jgi:hypothetical protein